MKIIHASNFSAKRDAADYWSMSYKLTSGLVRLGHYVYNFSDKATADSFFFGMRKLGIGHANRKLIAICRQILPDLVLFGHARFITPETMQAIRRTLPGVRLAQWNCDPLFDTENLAHVKSVAPHVDASFATTAGDDLRAAVSDGGIAAHMPNPVDPAIEDLYAYDTPNPDRDLMFMTRPDLEKQRLVDIIRARLPNLNFDLYGLNGRPLIHGSAMYAALAANKMGLNASRRNNVFLYSSDRMVHFAGNGLLTLVDRQTGFDTIFSDGEMAFYNGDDDLVGQIDRFSRDHAFRRAVAARGRKRIHEIFDHRLVARWILDLSFGEKPSLGYAWPTKVYAR
jgi:hypothetical protein